MRWSRPFWNRPVSTCGMLALLLLTSCASLQNKCSEKPWLLCGDRIEVHKDYVYLDDPAFLYHHKTVAHQRDGIYTFRLSLFFNPYRFKSAQVKAEIHPYRKPESVDSNITGMVMAGGALYATCRLETSLQGETKTDAGTIFTGLDSVYLASANAKKERITLDFLCRDYQPQWGRADTLTLRFIGGKPGEDSAAVLVLPFTTSFHGPVYSFAIGATLLLALTAVGELLAAGK